MEVNQNNYTSLASGRMMVNYILEKNFWPFFHKGKLRFVCLKCSQKKERNNKCSKKIEIKF